MPLFNRLTAVVLAAAMAAPVAPLEARSRKGDKFLAEGRVFEQKKEWDQALAAYGRALSEDPSDIAYQMAEQRCRFQTSTYHLDRGLKLRNQGQLGEALLELQRALTINPGSIIAEQEIRRTTEMIERERKRVQETGKEGSAAERAMTPSERARKEINDRIESLQPIPELKPITDMINLRINGTPKLLFETVARYAGLNVIWDPEYSTQTRNSSVELNNSTLQDALDYIGLVTKSYWKPISSNTIFITMDNPNKRRDYEEQVAKIFYLNNVASPQELQEIVNAVRSVTDIQRFFPYSQQNAIIAKGSADQIALAEKLLHDLDKPRSEVVVDIIVMEAASVYTRQLTAAVAPAGLNVPLAFTPRSGLQIVQQANTTGTTNNGSNTGSNTGNVTGNTNTSTTTTTTTTATASGGAGSLVPLANLAHISSADFSTTIPSALLQAVLSDARTKVLQSPQLRAVDNLKAVLKIGDRQPTATGSFQPGIGGVGINPLVNTQFNYIDVGVNVTIMPRVHDNNEVSLSIDLDISSVTGAVNLGGISQPIIGQRKVTQDVRLKDGEVQLLAGLTKAQDTKTRTGTPGLAAIPLIGRLFSGESIDREKQELMVALIPHIVRRPEFSAENLRGIDVGWGTTVHLNYGRTSSEKAPSAAPAKSPEPQAAAAPTAPVAAPVAPPVGVPGVPTGVPAAMPPATAPPETPSAAVPPATAPRESATPPDSAAPPKPAGNATVRFLPGEVNTATGSQMTVALIIENATDIMSSPLQISFDPKVVRLNDVTRGDFFTSDGQIPVFTKNIQNDAGSATINLNRLPGSAGVSGSGVLVMLNLQAVAAGTTPIRVSNLNVLDAKGQTAASGTPQVNVTVR
jgi:general secretion pathway protein D